MRIRGYLIVLGLCGLGLLTPAVAGAADCTKGQPFKVSDISFGGATFDFKATCKGDWQVGLSLGLSGDQLTTDMDATESATGKECHQTMFTPTGGTGDYRRQKGECEFTKDLDLKFSLQEK
jgi:hypothetical protein